MSCKFLRYRSKNYQKYAYCAKQKQKIDKKDCYDCNFKEYKETKPINKKTTKLQQLENNRYSIVQSQTEQCYNCHRKLPLDKHEAIGGKNRLKSIEWGLIFYLCRECHTRTENDQDFKNKFQVIAQNKFEELYGKEKFMQEFGQSYRKD